MHFNKNHGGKTMAGIKEFAEKAAADKDFAAKFENVQSAEELVKLASEEGFSFTVDDVNENSELSDDDLEGVAGGRSIFAKDAVVIAPKVFGVGFADGTALKKKDDVMDMYAFKHNDLK
jgi:predicted ribosomally synthesized peptide with nif11-like leader